LPGEDHIRETPPLPCATRHYTVAEIAEQWQLSDDVVRKIFEPEPGVLAIGEGRSTGHNAGTSRSASQRPFSCEFTGAFKREETPGLAADALDG
jgi:hypothetical protein